MKRMFSLYQYLAPAVLTPLCAWLWWRHYGGNAELVALALLVPILHAYIVPGIGTNVLGVWEFDVRFRLGRFRPHHGFVFGSSTSLLVLLISGMPDPQPAFTDMVLFGAKTAILLGVVNWIYDWAAIRAGILKVYNQPWADRLGPAAITNDYALWFFGGFGLLFGFGLKAAEGALLTRPNLDNALLIGAALVAMTITLPTIGYILQSYVRHGHHGCRPVAPQPGGSP
jgi:hypothetical protein